MHTNSTAVRFYGLRSEFVEPEENRLCSRPPGMCFRVGNFLRPGRGTLTRELSVLSLLLVRKQPRATSHEAFPKLEYF